MNVVRLSIAPVRSLGLEHPGSIDLTFAGVVEDRRFFLVDDNGRLIDRTSVGALVQVSAHTNAEATVLSLSFPDGSIMEDEVRLGAPMRTPTYRGHTAVGHVVEGPWAEMLSPIAGRHVHVVRCDEPGGTRKGRPATLVTAGSLAELGRHLGSGHVDARRFRMLVELDGTDPHEEDGWIGGAVQLGGAVLRIAGPVARCSITTQHPDSGVRDLDTLRSIIKYRGLRDGKKVDFGVWADVVGPGRIQVGDELVLRNGIG